MFSAYLAPLLLAAVAVAQNTALEVEAIQAHFTAAGIVPSLLSTFNPSAVATLNFPGVGDIKPGQSLTRAQVGPTPSVAITPANSTVTLTGNFTLAMVDAGPVGSDESQGVTRHWLVNGATVADNKVANASAVAITQYAGPAPPAGSGPHRYVVILYEQPASFSPPEEFSQPNIGVSVFDVNAYAQNSGLGNIVAATYITVEEGQTTASLSATSAVVTSTLPVPSSTGSQSHSGSHSATSGGAAPSQTSQGNSATTLETSWGLVALLAGSFAAML
ncbi:hypothetical protein HGRIS_013331 [Hohenbuehelia grisea]|uniref:PEBP-like protein n=1 Tax=Hohenbuehelia grisea TaxID=104357 RepID=A0ABR3IVA9_9AGAR